MVGIGPAVTRTQAVTPVRPVDAASLLIVRHGSDGAEVLMGRRPQNARFAPGVFVFPGGKIEREDFSVGSVGELEKSIIDKVAVAGSRRKAQGFAKAAVREAYEETGLLLVEPGEVGDVGNPSWLAIKRQGLAPALKHMDYVGRAITYAGSPVRFHARFFLVNAEHVSGEVRGNGELEDIEWHPIGQALALPIFDVTEFILSELGRQLRTYSPRKPVLSYRNGAVRVYYQ
jgi:8-oxo-dGTP pyrophosphatase MutT (NUDIX family)